MKSRFEHDPGNGAKKVLQTYWDQKAGQLSARLPNGSTATQRVYDRRVTSALVTLTRRHLDKGYTHVSLDGIEFKIKEVENFK